MTRRILPPARFAASSAGCEGRTSCVCRRWRTSGRPGFASTMRTICSTRRSTACCPDAALADRRTPSDLPLAGDASIASQWRREDRREPLKEDETDRVFNEANHNPAACYEMDDLISRMRRHSAPTSRRLGVFDHILADSDRSDAQAALGMNATQYDTARRRMTRRLFEAFHSGWNHEPPRSLTIVRLRCWRRASSTPAPMRSCASPSPTAST